MTVTDELCICDNNIANTKGRVMSITKSHPVCVQQWPGAYGTSLWDDGTVEYWSVYRQAWVQSDRVSDRELAAMGYEERQAVLAHLRQAGHKP